MNKDAKIFVAGHKGLVGSALVRRLERAGYHNLLLRSHNELDLCDQTATRKFLFTERPEYVFVAAALVGGIWANSTRPADFIYTNLVIETNLIQAAHEIGVKKLLFLGSTCIYPKLAPQPMKEECLLTGALEETNEWYAVAKIAGIKLCQAYRQQYGDNFVSVMPTNLYGPNDNFDLTSAHVLPALIRKFYEAKEGNAPEVVVWGSGAPRREFLYVDDMADACLFVMENYDQPEIINIGTGIDISIAELAALIKEIVGYSGEIVFDSSKPDGMMLKKSNVEKLRTMGWNFKTSLPEGLLLTYQYYVQSTQRKS